MSKDIVEMRCEKCNLAWFLLGRVGKESYEECSECGGKLTEREISAEEGRELAKKYPNKLVIITQCSLDTLLSEDFGKGRWQHSSDPNIEEEE